MNLETTVLLDGLGFPENPRWHDGKLWFGNGRMGQVLGFHRSAYSPVLAGWGTRR
jgi:hypothetical protein